MRSGFSRSWARTLGENSNWLSVQFGARITDAFYRRCLTVFGPSLRLDVGGKADDPHLMCQMHVTFEEAHGKTKLTLRMLFPSADAAGRAKELGAEVGGNESLDHLANFMCEATG